MSDQRNVAILIFDNVEVLDFAGPFEVFSVTGRRGNTIPFNVYTVAEKSDPVLARNGFSVNPRYTIYDCPPPDLVVVPGGYGTRREMNNPAIVEWVQAQNQRAELMLSVCTGSLIYGKAGLLNDLPATTHFGAFGELRAISPTITVREDVRFVDMGRIVTSAGISAGIDMALHIVARLLGEDQARETAQYMEYHWRNDGGAVR
jgi:transcriptional regulator GlxA family with amidase domain